MNPEDETSAPLTLDELIRLTAFLAECGHTDVAFEIVGTVAYDAVMASMSEAATR